MSIENSLGPDGGVSEDDFVENPQSGVEGEPSFIHFDDALLLELEKEEETESYNPITINVESPKQRSTSQAATFTSHSADALEAKT